MKTYCIYGILLSLLLSVNNISAQYAPYFKNYSLAEYKAGNQNWGISRSENGKVYVANNNGLLEYDGLKWRFYELPNKTTLRSVLAFKDFVFTGSYEEFGYWKKNNKGDLIYTSLSDTLVDEISLNEEFWQIIPYGDAIVFRSFSNIYIYNFNGKIQKITSNPLIITCDTVNDDLYVSTLEEGIFKLVDGKLQSEINHPLLVDTKVVSIDLYDEKLLITTSLKGCYFYENNTLVKANFNINEIIIQQQLNDFSILKDGRMVFGTIKDGIYLTDANGNILFHVNKENGLGNNTVLQQYLDYDNRLWLGLDNGLSSLDLSSENYFFNDVSGKLGAVYDVIKYKNVIYIGSNTGLFYLDEKNKLQFIEGSQGQVWNLKEIDGDLFCGHNEGTFLVKGFQLQKISEHTGGWTIKKVPEKPNVYIQGSYTGLIRYLKINKQWEVKRYEKATMPIRYLVFEDQNTAWAAHAYKGLYKVQFSENYDSIKSVTNYENKGLPSNFNVRVYKIKNDICFKTNNGWLKYEPLLDSIIPDKLLNDTFGEHSYIISEDNVNKLVLKNEKDEIRFKSFTPNNTEDVSLTSNFFNNRLIVGNENVSKINDSIYALNLNDGFMFIDHKFNSALQLQQPQIEKVKIDTVSVAFSDEASIDFKYTESLSVEVSAPQSQNHFFEYSFFDDSPRKWYQLEHSKLELSNIKHGSYTIAIRTSNSLGDVSEPQKMQINILPPWYKASLGFTLYGVIVVLILIIIFVLHKRKIEKGQRLLQQKFEKEQKELLREKSLENEKRIVQLKNESLQNEVKLKSKQLANTAMALVKKNETLQEIKKELAQNKTNFDNHYSYKKILKKVDGSIAHKDEWEVFEHNFNQVHDDFFKSLKAKHAELTPKDLKICAYVKMNLSTKEIAPLMNISIRGVETHRYRLKKKLNLENDISLTDYLLNFE